MTRDEIIRLAVECQLVTTGNRDGYYMDALVKFANVVVQAELDALREQEPAILPDEAYELGLDAIPYYAAPTPPSVPEGWQLVPDAKKLGEHKSAAYVLGWNECRAAMLEAQEPGEKDE